MILIINSAGIKPQENTGNDSSNEKSKMTKKSDMHFYLLPTAASIVVSHLKKAGYRVIFRDMNRRVSHSIPGDFSGNDIEQWLKYDKKTPLMTEYLEHSLEQLSAHWQEIKLIGISIISFIQFPFALSLAKELNHLFPNIPICLGGTYVSLSVHEYPGYISYIVKGNGGNAICHLADHIINQSPYNPDFPGLHQIITTQPPGNQKNYEPADAEELPDFSDLNIEDYLGYLNVGIFYGRRPPRPYLVANYRISMGCAMRCSFCTLRKVDTLRFKNPEKILKELEHLENLYTRYNMCIVFTDNSINGNLKHLNEVLDRILENNLKFKWMSFANIRKMNPGLWEKIAKSGCKALFWGMEGATPHMRKIFNKQFSDQLAENCFLTAVEHQIVNIVSLIYNAPGETDEDFQALLDFLVKFSKYRPLVIPNMSEFYMEENSDIYNNPADYHIEIIKQPGDGYSNERHKIQWKEINMDWTTFENRKQNRKERVRKLVKELWGFEVSDL